MTEAGSGGLVAGSAARPKVDIDSTVLAEVGDGADINVHLQDGTTADVTGEFTLSALHTARPDTYVVTESYGLIGGSGADADSYIDVDVTSRVGDNDGDAAGASITADHIEVAATNQAQKSAPSDVNIDGNAGGVAAGAGAVSDIDIILDTVVDIDNYSYLETVFSAPTTALPEAGAVVLKAINSINVTDEVALFTGGALSGAGAFVELNSDQLLAEVDIGAMQIHHLRRRSRDRDADLR